MLLICGEALFDLFLEEPESKHALKLDARAGGSPFNVAIGLSRLGSAAALLTGISTDFLGQKLLAQLSDEGVETSFLIRNGRRTTLSVVGLNQSGVPDYAFYGVGSADCAVEVADLPVLGDAITGLHFGSYSCVVDPASSTLEVLAERCADRFISFDPNVRLTVEPSVDVWRERIARFVSIADVIKISDEDFQLLWPDHDVAAKAQEWLAGRASLVVLTKGADPARAWTSSFEINAPQTPPVDVVDTVGAGDTFQAALLSQLGRYEVLRPNGPKSLSEDQLRSILAYASAAASVTCSRRGADLPRAEEVIVPSMGVTA